MRFEYPTKTGDVKTEVDLAHYRGASNQFGYYPLGRLNNWHGGIHVEGYDEPLRAISDGRIIAYRIPDKYMEETIRGRKSIYSNGFVLIQHFYESPNKTKLTFYSLYNHLRPYEKEAKFIPPPFSREAYSVGTDARDSINVKGIKIWENSKKMFGFTIPDGTVVETEAGTTVKGSLSKDMEYRKIKYPVTKWGKTFEGYFMATSKDYATKVNDTHYKVNLAKDGKSYSGLALRSKKDKEEKNITDIIPQGTKLELKKEADGWATIEKDGKFAGYVSMKGVEVGPAWDVKPEDLNTIKKGCNIPVKAGTVIGYTSFFGLENQEQYRSAHLEVFTFDDVTSFLTNTKGDGEKAKNYVKLAIGEEAKNNFAYKLAKDTEVKIIGTDGEYSKIEIGDITKTIVDRDSMGAYKNGYYVVPQDKLDGMNTVFSNILVAGDSLKLLDSDEEVEKKKAKKPEDKSRKVSYSYTYKGKTFWVPTAKITEPKDDKGKSTGTPYLNADVTEIMLETPSKFTSEKTEVEIIIDLKQATKYLDHEKAEWYWAEQPYFAKNGTVKTYKGFIKPKAKEKFSAYDWDKFGFMVMKDSHDDYIFDCKEKAPLLNGVWELIDTDGDKVLEPLELYRAFHNHYIVSKLSKLVCYHVSEWSMNDPQRLSSLKSKVKEMYDKGIKNEKDPVRKQEMKDYLEEKLAATEERIKNLCFWDEVDFMQTEGEEPEKNEFEPQFYIAEAVSTKYVNPRAEMHKQTLAQLPKAPSDPHVYHFHPIAFVEQMRRYQKRKIDLRSLLQFEAQEYSTDCHLTCLRIISKLGVSSEGSTLYAQAFPYKSDGKTRRLECFYQLADENYERNALVFRDFPKINEAYNYLDNSLEFGHPVIVGVNHHFEYKGNGGYNEGTTDHYVVIVGRKYIEGQLNYIYWDVATSRGASTEWYFELRDNKLISDSVWKTENEPYTVTQIRRNLDNDGKIITY